LGPVDVLFVDVVVVVDVDGDGDVRRGRERIVLDTDS
jgi:hypothetical protein